MKNGYTLLTFLTNSLNNSYPIITKITNCSKDEFSLNDEYITLGLGIVNEIKEITVNLDSEIYMLNKTLYNLLTPISNYSHNLFNEFKLVNTYKLYDSLKVDIPNLRTFLNEIIEKN